MKKISILFVAAAMSVAAMAGSTKSLDLSQFSVWDENATYDAATTTLTVKTAWKGGQIWYGDGEYALDATGYGDLILELKQAATGTIKLSVDYSNCIVPAQEIYIEPGQTIGTLSLNGTAIQKISISADRGAADNVIVFKELRLQSAQEYTDVTLWTGTWNAGNWSSDDLVIIDADRLTQLKEGDKIAVTVSAIDPQQEWPGVYIYPKGNWDDQIVEQSVKDQIAPLVVEFTLNASQVATAKANGIMIRGCGFTMTSVVWKKTSPATSLFNVKAALNDGIRRDVLGNKVDASYRGIVILNGHKMLQ